MRNPLLLKNFVSFLTNVERLASPKIPVFFSMSIQIYGTPEAEAVTSNDDNY
jgi:hypothetical protein